MPRKREIARRRLHARGGAPRTARERGAALMETAVLAPLLLVVAVGIADLGRAAFAAIEVENAAQTAAAYGAVSKDQAVDADGIESAALNDLGGEAYTSNVTVESERYCECPDGSSIDCDSVCEAELPYVYVRVAVAMSFETLVNYPGFPSDLAIGREAHMRVQ
jgi:hypothetical protein